MKAMIRDAYGPADVVHCDDLPTPVVPDDEVLLRVEAARGDFAPAPVAPVGCPGLLGDPPRRLGVDG